MISKIEKTKIGEISRQEGHDFEEALADYLQENFNIPFEVLGGNLTKIDIQSKNGKLRCSVKNPKNKNTQVALISQKSFIKSFGITDQKLIHFMACFFGSDHASAFPRHRMSKSDIPNNLNAKFTVLLNENKMKLFETLISRGNYKDRGVNYLLWANKKNSVEDVIVIDIKKFKEEFKKGNWIQNETTFDYIIDGTKILHLQMKGSGKKYTSGYHSLMFHLHSEKFTKKENLIDAEIEFVSSINKMKDICR